MVFPKLKFVPAISFKRVAVLRLILLCATSVFTGLLAVTTAKALDVSVPLGGNIQTAINQVNTAGGGNVILQAGTYTNTVPLNMKSFVTLTGQGPSSTTITNTGTGNVIQQANEGLANVTIANLKVVGKQTNSCYGILLQALSTYHTNIVITNVEVAYAGMGVHLKRVSGVKVVNCNIHENGTTFTNDYGFMHNLYIRQCDNTNYSVIVTNCQLNNSLSGNGLNLSYNANVFVDRSTATNNWFRGMRAADTVGFTVQNCTLSGNGDAGLLANAEITPTVNVYWSSNVVYNNGNGGLKTVSGVTGTAVFNDACGNTPADYSLQSSMIKSGNTTCGSVPVDTWNGGSPSTGNWSDTANWNGATVNSGDMLFFAGTTRVANTNNFSGYSFSGVTFNSGAGQFNLNGNAFDLSGGITNNSTSGQTINNNITLSVGNHVISAPASTANITNNGNISEDGSGAASLTFSTPGSRTLVLNGSNSFTGGFTLTGNGTTQFGLMLGHTNALGTGPLSCNGGTLVLTTLGANPFIITNAFTTSRDVIFAGNNVIFTGPVTHSGSKQFQVNNGVTATLNGGLALASGDVVLKSLPGTLVLNGATTGAGGLITLNGVAYPTTTVTMRVTSGNNGGTLVLGNPSALGTGFLMIDAGNSTVMANTDLSGANALANDVVLNGVLSSVSVGATIGGANNLTFNGNLFVSIGNAGAVTRHLIVTNTAATAFSGANVFLSDGASAGTLSVNVAGTSGGVTISGSIVDGNQPGGSLIKTNTGRLTLSGTNTYTGPTTVSNGMLVVNGSLSTNAVNVYGGMLAGTGTINGPTTIFAGTLSPGSNGVIGRLTISNSLSLQGTLAVDINKTTGTNDLITGLTTVTYGGSLAVNNLSGTLTTSDSFKLFSAGTYNGAFTNIAPATPAPGLVWNTNTLTTDGILRVATASAPLTSIAFTASPVISGTSLTISATNTGAGTVYLLTSTNVAAPLNTWTPIWTNILTGSGSFTTNLANAVNPALNQQFYRLANTNN